MSQEDIEDRPEGQQDDVVELAELADSLIAELGQHHSGRTARTVLSGTVMRATLIALQEGAELSEHDAPAAATVYVIRGRVSLRAGEKSWALGPGELVPVPHQRHSVMALSDAAFLLTVALR